MSRPQWPSVAFWSVTLLALAALRLPYLTSPLYILDPDEAVLGLMARHLAAGEEFPVYFAGQAYGVSIFETLPLAAAFQAFGESSLVVALTMLALYSVGLLGYAKAFRNLAGSVAWGRALTILLAVLPGWIVWSTKARGIYVSGFVLTGFALALLTQAHLTRREVLGVGVLMGLVGLGQPLWLVVTLPLLLLGNRPRRDIALASLVATGLWLSPLLLRPSEPAFWNPHPFQGFYAQRLGLLPRVLTRAFSGRVPPNEPGVMATLVGVTCAMGFFASMIALAVSGMRSRVRLPIVVGTAMCASIIHITVLRVWAPRYFLPATVLGVVSVAAWVGTRPVRFAGIYRLVAILSIVISAVAAFGQSHPPEGSRLRATPAQEDMRALIANLEGDGVRGVYAQHSDIQWQILFYGDERLPTRGISREDRYPHFPRAVDEARRAGLPTAYVADIRQLRRELPTDSFPGYRVGERYLRLDDPDLPLLFVMNFQLSPVDAP